MKKKEIRIEYPLRNASLSFLWNMIGTPLGLAEWFADGVTVNNDIYTFVWEGHEQTAKLLSIKPLKNIRFRWNDDVGTDYYFEIAIQVLALTSEITLLITDFADPKDEDDLILLWNSQVDTLRRKNGI